MLGIAAPRNTRCRLAAPLRLGPAAGRRLSVRSLSLGPGWPHTVTLKTPMPAKLPPLPSYATNTSGTLRPLGRE